MSCDVALQPEKPGQPPGRRGTAYSVRSAASPPGCAAAMQQATALRGWEGAEQPGIEKGKEDRLALHLVTSPTSNVACGSPASGACCSRTLSPKGAELGRGRGGGGGAGVQPREAWPGPQDTTIQWFDPTRLTLRMWQLGIGCSRALHTKGAEQGEGERWCTYVSHGWRQSI